MTYTDGLCHIPACPRLGRVSAGVHKGWELECGDWRANPGRRLLSAVRRQPEGTGGRQSQVGMLMEETWTATEARCHC